MESEFGEVLKHYNLTLDLPLQSLSDIHLTSHYMQEFEVNGNSNTVKYLSLIAILIMVLAWVNYINLTTARSLTRAKEVGLRKATGARRPQLFFQFLLETILTNLAAFILALVSIELLLNPFSKLTGIQVDVFVHMPPWFWGIIVILFVSGILALRDLPGFYSYII